MPVMITEEARHQEYTESPLDNPQYRHQQISSCFTSLPYPNLGMYGGDLNMNIIVKAASAKYNNGVFYA